jgi:flagellar motility protein MotE (MotC chaperone)
MRSATLSVLALCFSLPAAIALWDVAGVERFFAVSAETHPLLKGCADVPEAMVLAEELASRARGIERHMAALDAKRTEITNAEAALRQALQELSQKKSGRDLAKGEMSASVRGDVDRLVAVYDQMKPAEAAAVLANLPVEFAAEILMRLRPENGARIISAVEPHHAAMLTARMGARSVKHQ